MSDDSRAGALRQIAFIGGGNTARAIPGDLLRACTTRAASLIVVAPQPDKLRAEFGLRALSKGDARLSSAELALATSGAVTALGLASGESHTLLRERVTSKGSTTYAKISLLQADGMCAAIRRTVSAAEQPARELAWSFGV